MTPRYLRPGLDAVAVTTAILATFLASATVTGLLPLPWGYDAHAYWSFDIKDPYALPMNTYGAFLYSPVFALAIAPTHLLPEGVFVGLWTALLAAATMWLGRGAAALLFLVPAVPLEILSGNIHLLLASAVVLGFRWPAAWSFVILTKVTPGIGLLWFAARGERRALAIALGVTAALLAASALIAPVMLLSWLDRLLDSGAGRQAGWQAMFGPLWLRVVAAGLIAVWAGLRGKRWPVVVSVLLALPNPSLQAIAILVACVPLVALDRTHPLPPRTLPRRAGWPVPTSARAGQPSLDRL